MSKKVSDVFINFLDKKDRDIAQGRQQGMQAEQLRMQHRQHKEQSLTEKFNQAFKTMQADRAQQNLETGRTREDQLNEIKQQNVVDNRQHQIDIMNQRDGLADGNREDAQSHDINMLNRRHSNSQEMDLLNHEQALATKSVSKSDGPISLEQKMAKLSGENRKRFDNIRMGINAINDIQSALDSGTRKFSLKGDNKFTASRRLFTEAIGRMQSGGAINSEEAKSFKGLLPSVLDSKEVAKFKMEKLQGMLNDRLESMGFSADELGLTAPDNIPTPGSVEAPTSSSKEIMSIDDELAEIEKQLGK